MDIIIIEDEPITAEDLREIIIHVNPQANVVKILSSVKEAISYLRANPAVDLIFSDIQLGDGLSFEIYQQVDVKAPIVFCTAYDEYALTAFRTNGIHYILKPFNEVMIQEALTKFHSLKSTFSLDSQALLQLMQTLTRGPQDKSTSILVYQREKVIPVKIKDIALFYIKNEVCHLYTFDQKNYLVNKSLDEIQQIVGNEFYRANRQYIINRDAIKEASSYLARKVNIILNIPFTESIMVSKEKMSDFYTWLTGE
ncbi:MAG: LytTR family DNA-binding domain-containing protein [Sporocytophaga sp.]|nr:LytTR family DNA-binding domain-containing protein [Sporocytophaga sp.]